MGCWTYPSLSNWRMTQQSHQSTQPLQKRHPGDPLTNLVAWSSGSFMPLQRQMTMHGF
ncbi:hypothetical protein ACHAXS_008425 [Conticribra weissflogii]